jgi:succinate dehydrogenase flavin-adding protein (antitoxin of CptAB toxin-antitoxin module)
MKTYIVVKGIFENTIFKGIEQNDRIYNKETVGQSYPLDNCIEYDYIVDILLIEGNKKLKSTNTTLSTILEFGDFEFVKWYFKINFTESKTKKEIIKQMFDYLNNEGFQKYNILINSKN